MEVKKEKLSCKKGMSALSVIIFCALVVISMQLNVFAVDSVLITTDGMPEELTVVKGQSVKLSGSMTSNSIVDRLEIFVSNYNGGIGVGKGIIHMSYPNSNQFDFSSITINSNFMDDNKLKAFPTPGKYDIYIYAIVDDEAYRVDTVSINVLNVMVKPDGIPQELTVVKGQSVKLSGSMTSNSIVDRLEIFVSNYNGGIGIGKGIIHMSYPNSDQFDFSSITIDSNFMDNNKLKAFPTPGKYDLYIYAIVDDEAYRVCIVNMNVLNVMVKPDGIPQELTVVKGQSVKMTGSISCNSVIDDLVIYDGSYVYTYETSLNSDKFDLSSITIDSKYITKDKKLEAFSTPGEYYLYIDAIVDGEDYRVGNFIVNVLDIKITPTGIPEKLTVVKGQSVKMAGSISCNSVIDDLVIYDGVYIMLVARGFNTVKGNARYSDAYDLNKDGAINMQDIMLLASRFNTKV